MGKPLMFSLRWTDRQGRVWQVRYGCLVRIQ